MHSNCWRHLTILIHARFKVDNVGAWPRLGEQRHHNVKTSWVQSGKTQHIGISVMAYLICGPKSVRFDNFLAHGWFATVYIHELHGFLRETAASRRRLGIWHQVSGSICNFSTRAEIQRLSEYHFFESVHFMTLRRDWLEGAGPLQQLFATWAATSEGPLEGR